MGYRGRIGAFETLAIEGDLRNYVGKGIDANTLDEAARRADFTTMMDDAIAKCREGVTSVSEVLRVTTPR